MIQVGVSSPLLLLSRLGTHERLMTRRICQSPAFQVQIAPDVEYLIDAARAAVAEGYMKQCTGLWIVAPINRAVDDKAAKSLLGESFKRQLKMDGGFSS